MRARGVSEARKASFKVTNVDDKYVELMVFAIQIFANITTYTGYPMLTCHI